MFNLNNAYMKVKFFLLLPFLALVWLSSCEGKDFLDETVTTDLSHEAVFSDSTLTVNFLGDIYREIGFDTDPIRFTNSGGLQTACDEAHYRLGGLGITDDVMFISGTVNPVVILDDAWTKGYQSIRKVNIFLASVDKSPLSDNLKRVYKAEARFLRAWYYFIMLRHYGGIPLIGDQVYSMADVDAGNIKTERDSFEDCVEYIVSECEALSNILPVKPSGLEGGRAGSGACLSLISRVRLYAASPLFNGSSWGADVADFDKKLVGYPTYDINRWKLAMDASQRVITSGYYDLFVDNIGPDPANPEPGYGFYRIMLPDDGNAPSNVYIEDIFSRRRPRSTDRPFAPPSLGNGRGGHPYQEFVDLFPMKDGKAINDPTSKYKYTDADPYKDRDPRFYNSIVYDGTRLPAEANSALVTINIFITEGVNERTQDAVGRGTPTGYYIKKFTHRTTSTNSVHGVSQVRPLMRFAEILLNYAEARNEFSGPSDEVYLVLTSLRDRAGIEPGDDNMYGLKANMTQAEMREAIRFERRIELAFEGHRFWDVRRWMIAEVTDNQQMTGMAPTLQTNGTKTYPRFNVYKHIFHKQMYLWPFPDSEVAKAPLLKQNPYY